MKKTKAPQDYFPFMGDDWHFYSRAVQKVLKAKHRQSADAADPFEVAMPILAYSVAKRLWRRLPAQLPTAEAVNCCHRYDSQWFCQLQDAIGEADREIETSGEWQFVFLRWRSERYAMESGAEIANEQFFEAFSKAGKEPEPEPKHPAENWARLPPPAAQSWQDEEAAAEKLAQEKGWPIEAARIWVTAQRQSPEPVPPLIHPKPIEKLAQVGCGISHVRVNRERERRRKLDELWRRSGEAFRLLRDESSEGQA